MRGKMGGMETGRERGWYGGGGFYYYALVPL